MNEIENYKLTNEQLALILALKSTQHPFGAVIEKAEMYLKWLNDNKTNNK